MSDEIASATLQTSQKAIEVALELIKMLAPLAQKLLSEVYHKSVDGINDVGGKIANARSLGTVSAKNLVVEAQKANSPISTTSNFLARDAEQIAAKADTHLLIEKSVSSNRTFTVIKNLCGDDRINEIARIMSGSDITENLYNSAKELLDRSKNNEDL